jgi:hypothetical protein
VLRRNPYVLLDTAELSYAFAKMRDIAAPKLQGIAWATSEVVISEGGEI